MTALTVTFAGLYVIAGLTAAMILMRRSKSPASSRSRRLSAMVVVAARNEAERLPACLSALSRQNYGGSLHFVVVDDHSSDETRIVAESFAANDPRFTVIAMDDESGKAAALATGIESSPARIIVTTDADCQPPPDWVASMIDRLIDERLGVVSGPTVVTGEALSARVQTLDWMLLFGIAGAASAAGVPVTAMGNNMALDREAYDAVGGYRAFQDGPTEDYALFRAVGCMSRKNARLLVEEGLKNFTEPAPGLRAAFAQRKRWAKGGLVADRWVHLLYVLVWLAHVLPLLAAFFHPLAAAIGVAALATTDAAIVLTMGRRIRQKPPWSAFLPFEVFLFGYTVLMPFAIAVRPEIQWKGRRY